MDASDPPVAGDAEEQSDLDAAILASRLTAHGARAQTHFCGRHVVYNPLTFKFRACQLSRGLVSVCNELISARCTTDICV